MQATIFAICLSIAMPGRQAGRAFIPAASRGVAGLWRVNGELLRTARALHPVAQATLDMDAALIETRKVGTAARSARR